MDEKQQEPVKKKYGGSATDHLANERTFLAWIRTSIAIMAFGFVVVKFALFIRQVSIALGEKAVLPAKGLSAVIGILLVALGGVIALLAFFRYRNIEKQLNDHSYFPSKSLSISLTLFILVISILLVLYLVPNM